MTPAILTAWLLVVLGLPFTPLLQASTPICGATLTSNTKLDADMVCSGTALYLTGNASRNVTLNCDGHSISSTDGNTIIISAARGVTVKNCVLTTDTYFTSGILLDERSKYSLIKNNSISTAAFGSHGIVLSNARDNTLSGNSIHTTGLNSNAVHLNSSAKNNQVSNNTLQSDASYPIHIESSSNNGFSDNRLNSPLGFLLQSSTRLQDGGLGIDGSGNIYAIENSFGSSAGIGTATAFFQVDATTGAAGSPLPVLSAGNNVGLGFSALEVLPDGRIFALSGCCSLSTLFEIDPLSAEVTAIALNLPVLSGMANGLEATSNTSLLATTDQGELLNIDLSNGNVTLIGSQATGWSDLAIHPLSAKAYAVSRWQDEFSNTAHLYEINPGDGQIIGEIGDTGLVSISSIDFAPDETLYGDSFGTLVAIDLADAATTQLGGTFGPDPLEPLPNNNRLKNNRMENADGSVIFPGNLILPSELQTDLSAAQIAISANAITIDSATSPFLDEPARIDLDNLPGTYRNLLVDPQDDGSFLPCASPQCKFVSFLNGTLTFDVSGFTSYSSEENTTPTLEFVAAFTRSQIKALQQTPGVSKSTKKKLKAAKEALTGALQQIDKENLKKAFSRLANAVDALASAENKLAETGDLIDKLADSVKAEAQAAIDNALATGGASTFVTEAQAKMALAQSLLDEDDPVGAINAYKKAWSTARKGYKYRIGGTLEGLSGGSVVLQQNGSDDLLLTANGSFSFNSLESRGVDYHATLLTPPLSPHHDCKVKKSRGRVATSDITSIVVKCSIVPGPFAFTANALDQVVNSFSLNHGTGEITEVLPAAGKDWGATSIAVDPSGRFVYLANGFSSEGTIDSFHIIPDSGSLTPIGTSTAGDGVFFTIDVDPTGRFAYAVNVARAGPDLVVIFRIDPESGALTQVGSANASEPGSFGVTADPTGRFVYLMTVEPTFTDANVAIFKVDPALGTLTEVGNASTSISPNSIKFTHTINVHPTARFAYVADVGRITTFSIDPANGLLTQAANQSHSRSFSRSITIDAAGRFAYQANLSLDEIATYSIDPVSGGLTEVDIMPSVGGYPQSVAIDPTGRFALVTSGQEASADPSIISTYKIDPDTGLLSSTGFNHPTAIEPTEVAMSPPRRFAYVANANSDEVSIFSIDPRSGKLSAVGTTATGTGPLSITVDPGGRFAYAANVASHTVTSYSIHPQNGQLTETGEVATGTNPLSVSVDPTGRFAYVTNVGSNDVTSFRIDANTGELGETGSEIAAGDAPNALSVEPTGRFAYVANVITNDVTSYSIDPATGALGEIGDEVAVGTAPRAIAVHPSGRFAYVANQASDNITSFSIDLETGLLAEIGTEVAAGDSPKAMTIHPTGRFAYVANQDSGDVSTFTIDPVSGMLSEVGTAVTSGAAPRAISVDSTGRFAYVSNFDDDNITRFSIDPVSGALSQLGNKINTGSGPHSISILGGSH